MGSYGMELVKVRIKRVNYVQSVRQTVYERMISERLRIARLYDSEAVEEKNKILGQTQKELDQIEGEMEKAAAEIRGNANAQVIQLTADAYGKSPEFYEFLRRLEVFKQTFGPDTRLILSTESDLFRLLKARDHWNRCRVESRTPDHRVIRTNRQSTTRGMLLWLPDKKTTELQRRLCRVSVFVGCYSGTLEAREPWMHVRGANTLDRSSSFSLQHRLAFVEMKLLC
jgi:hypothetical protein